MRKLLIGISIISSPCLAQGSIEDYEQQYNAQFKHCGDWYNIAVQNGCVNNAYVHSDQARTDQCMQNALQQRTGCEQSARSTYEARVANLTRYNRMNEQLNQHRAQNDTTAPQSAGQNGVVNPGPYDHSWYRPPAGVRQPGPNDTSWRNKPQ